MLQPATGAATPSERSGNTVGAARRAVAARKNEAMRSPHVLVPLPARSRSAATRRRCRRRAFAARRMWRRVRLVRLPAPTLATRCPRSSRRRVSSATPAQHLPRSGAGYVDLVGPDVVAAAEIDTNQLAERGRRRPHQRPQGQLPQPRPAGQAGAAVDVGTALTHLPSGGSRRRAVRSRQRRRV